MNLNPTAAALETGANGSEVDSPPGGPPPERPLREVVDRAVEHLRSEVSRGATDFPGLTNLPDSLCIKNAHGVIVYSNAAHRRLFTPNASPIGRTSHAYLDPVMAARAEAIEGLILGGCPFVECEHSGPGPDGSLYRMLAHKRSLRSLNAPGLAILGVIRLLACDRRPEAAARLDLTVAAARFRELAPRDQEVCRLTALGASSRELGEKLGMTTRGIELRKQKAFSHLGVSKAVELARLLTRLQDSGRIDLGL